MSQPDAAVASAIAAAARRTGVSASYLTAAARRESAFDPSAKAATSSAAGLFQFIESTWLATLKSHAGALGLDAAEGLSREQALALRFDPATSALLAGVLTAENAAALGARLGRAPSDGELYAAHVLGAHGAADLLEAAAADPGRAAAELFPRAADANHGLFFDPRGEAVSVAKLAERLTTLPGAAVDPKPGTRASAPPAPPGAPEGAPASVPARLAAARRGVSAMGLAPQTIEILASLEAPERAKRADEG